MHTIHEESTQESFDFVTEFYCDDFDGTQLQLHLDILRTMFPSQLKSLSLSFHNVRKYIQSLSEAECALISEVVTWLKRILVLPSTNAASAQSLRRLKTYLRNTMKQERLNHLFLLHVRKDRTDNLSCIEVVKSFVGDSDHRLSVFGQFQ